MPSHNTPNLENNIDGRNISSTYETTAVYIQHVVQVANLALLPQPPNTMETSHASGLGASNAREFVSSLISAIPPAIAPEPSPNPLKDLPPATRSIFLTLYALFEKECLPALDLLDRGLVTRMKIKAAPEELPGKNNCSVYLVRSAQQHSNSRNTYEHINYYEVRLKAWSCSCPAFTFSAFPASDSNSRQIQAATAFNNANAVVGGLTLGTDMPVCKHLIACLLVENCQLFAHLVDEREVSQEEIAGWAAGWGD